MNFEKSGFLSFFAGVWELLTITGGEQVVVGTYYKKHIAKEVARELGLDLYIQETSIRR